MSRALVSSLAVVVLAGLFFVFFQAAKQVPFLADANPFADDPYDAVGSFAIQAAGALAALSVVRALGFLTTGDRASLLARTQLASVLSVAITLVTDAIAMARRPEVWWPKPGGLTLAVMAVALVGMSASVGIVCARTPGRTGGPPAPAIAVCTIAILALVLYPESTRGGLAGAFAAIAAGIVLLFVVLRVLVTALIGRPVPPRRRRFPVEWVIVLIVSLTIGLLIASAEAGAERGLRPGVVFIFVGFEVAAVVFGYAVMRGPLELTL